jgi:ABC-2 type transport system permease protein
VRSPSSSPSRRISPAGWQRGDHPQILIEADATDPSAASGAVSTLGPSPPGALARACRKPAAARGAALEVVVHQRYNPEGITQYNMVPGCWA